MFRWDKWLEGAAASGLAAVVTGLIPLLSDGTITKSELGMLGVAFLSGVGLYLKTHPVDPLGQQMATIPPISQVSDLELINQENDPQALLEDKLKEIESIVTNILHEIDIQERPTREIQIKIWKYLDLLWTGICNFYWNSTSNQWKPITYDDIRHLSESADIDPTLLNKTINMLRPYGESIIGALTVALPQNKYFPADADQVDDINTAKAYRNIEQKIALDNNMKTKIVQMILNLLTGGFFAAYNYSHSDEKYGTVSQELNKTVKFRISNATCPDCGFEALIDKSPIPDDDSAGMENGLSETVNEPVKDEEGDLGSPAPELTTPEGNEGEGLEPPLEPQTGVPCPNCGSPALPEQSQELSSEIQPDGNLIVPKSRQIIEIFGPLQVKIPTHASKKEDVMFLILEDEVHESMMRSLYPKYKDKIQPGSHDNLAYDRWARSQYENMGELNQYYITRRRMWLRPIAYEMLKTEEAPELLNAQFPEGLLAVFSADTLLFIEAAELDDHWTLSLNPVYRRLYGDPLLKAAIPLQEAANDLFQLELETVKYAIPQSFADPEALDFEQYGKSKNQPGLIYPMKSIGGQSIANSITSTITASLPKEVSVLEEKLEKYFQFVLGVFPSVFGGEAAGSRTLGEYEQSRGQALQRLAINPQHVIHAAYAELMAKSIKAYCNDLLEDEVYVTAKGNSFVNTWIRKADLQGKIGEVRPEQSEQFPSSWGQKKATWLELLQTNNPMIIGTLMHPENMQLANEILGIDELYIPGDDQRNKQLNEIKALIASPPNMPPVDPQTGQAPIDQMTGQPVQPTSSVPIEPIDDDNIHHQVLAAFICSEVGQTLKEENPQAYMNLLLHDQEHQQRMQQAQMQAQMAQAQPQPQQKQQLGEAKNA